MIPYICVDLDLDEQLIKLSTAVHMAFFLYRDSCARTQLMPTQSYVDIMIMIKNIFSCVAKAKVDNPHSKFYLILLGTDRLETFFGLIRTAIGTDANIDILQLGSRASGLTEVALILAENPEWDPSPCHLTLPHIGKDIHEGKSPPSLITSSQRTGMATQLLQGSTFILVGSWDVSRPSRGSPILEVSSRKS